MELELDYNIELFPLSKGDHVAVALASSLSREPVGVAAEGEEADNKNTWRPGISANPGLEEDYDYVMFGKVRGVTAQVPQSIDALFRSTSTTRARGRDRASLMHVPHFMLTSTQNRIRVVRRVVDGLDGEQPTSAEPHPRRVGVHPTSQVDHTIHLSTYGRYPFPRIFYRSSGIHSAFRAFSWYLVPDREQVSIKQKGQN